MWLRYIINISHHQRRNQSEPKVPTVEACEAWYLTVRWLAFPNYNTINFTKELASGISKKLLKNFDEKPHRRGWVCNVTPTNQKHSSPAVVSLLKTEWSLMLHAVIYDWIIPFAAHTAADSQCFSTGQTTPKIAHCHGISTPIKYMFLPWAHLSQPPK